MEEARILLERAHQGDKAARDEMVKKNTGLVWSIVRRFGGRGCEMEDLFQIGTIGLMKAIDHFDLTFSFGKKEMQAFEQCRSTFPRESIQYGYDATGGQEERKLLAYPMDRSYEDVFRMLALRCPPPEIK